MKKRTIIVLTIVLSVISILSFCMILIQKSMEASDAYHAVVQYLSSDKINRTYGSLEKKGWFTYGKILTGETTANMQGSAEFEFEAENAQGEDFIVEILLTLENQIWVVTECNITARSS